MREVLMIDDADVDFLVEKLNHLSHLNDADLNFSLMRTPAPLFSQTATLKADCVILDHQWNGYKISDIVNTIFQINANAVVVVYTFKVINISELVECVRLGVVEYWSKDQIEGDDIIPRIVTLCSSPAFSVKNQRMMDGMARKLATELDKVRRANENFASEIQELRIDVVKYKASERRQLMANFGRLVQASGACVVLVVVFLVLKTSAKIDGYSSLALMAVLGVFMLFLLEKVSLIDISIGKSKGKVKS